MINILAENTIRRHQAGFHPVVRFDPRKDRLVKMDFTSRNQELTSSVISDTGLFSQWVTKYLSTHQACYGIGGYGEERTVYDRSPLFDSPGEPRRVHLGTDIWGEAGTPVFAFMGGMVHSFAFNDHYGDYGATLILLHQLDGMDFYTLYGHISLKDISHLSQGQYVTRGETIASFGIPAENGHWPPHLHFQVIMNMELQVGDYPGVCRASEKEKYLFNCPNPDIILQLEKYC